MQGFVRIPNKIFKLALKGCELKVFCIISALTFGSGHYVKLSVSAFIRHTGLSESGVKRALKALIERGIIKRSSTFIDGCREANRYAVAIKFDMRRGYTILDLNKVREFPSDKLLIYAALFRHADKYGYTYVSERSLALELGISRNTVRKYTSELELEGVIKKEARFYKKHRATNARRCFAYLCRHISDAFPSFPAPRISASRRLFKRAFGHSKTRKANCIFAALNRIFIVRAPP